MTAMKKIYNNNNNKEKPISRFDEKRVNNIRNENKLLEENPKLMNSIANLIGGKRPLIYLLKILAEVLKIKLVLLLTHPRLTIFLLKSFV